MYDAYASEEVVSKLPFDVTSIISYDKKDKLLIGSKQGHLLSCDHAGKRSGFEYQVCRTFEKRLINELKVVESHDLILCLSDNQLTVHDANEPYKLLDTLNKYRPITCFSFNVREHENLLQVVISSRKRIHYFKWLVDKFEEEQLNLNPACLLDYAQLLAFCEWNSLVVAVRNEYFFVQLFKESSNTGRNEQLYDEPEEVGKLKSLNTTGTRPVDSPLIVQLYVNWGTNQPKKHMVGIGKDNFLIFISQSGKPAKEFSNCRFSDYPLAIAYDSPYLLAVLPKSVLEIRSVEPFMLIQKLQLDKAVNICSGRPGTIYVGSDHTAWRLSSKPLVKKNVEFLTEEKQFKLAIQLADQNESLVDSGNLVEIKRRMALECFNQKKFADCFHIHLQLKTEVLLVMNLFSRLIPEKYLAMLSKFNPNELVLFDPTVDLPENEKKVAVLTLGDYLSEKRTECAQLIALHYKDFKEGKKQNLLPTATLKKQEAILELVDTVLLKCYLLTKPMLVSSLLRLPDNSCLISEAEKDLYPREKFLELLILYERKKMHKKSLELLKKESKKEESSLVGVERMSEYLQALGNENARLIFEYSPMVLAESVQLGVQIFTANEGNQSRNLDREEVLHFLRKHCIRAIIPYLEHIIYKCHEQRPKFHEELAEHLVLSIKILMKDYVHALEDEELRTAAGQEEGELGDLRKRLLHFLETSKDYSSERLLLKLDDNMLEERAIIYGRLKKHEEALSIYSNILFDFSGAERYCSTYYDANDEVSSKVFFMLFKAYASAANEFSTPSGTRLTVHKQKINVNEALKVLKKHAGKIDTVKAISLIHMETPLSKVWEALEAVFEAIKNRATQSSLLLSIIQLASKDYERKLQKMRNQKILIDSTVNCCMCTNKIADGAFVRLPSNQIAHFFCFKRKL